MLGLFSGHVTQGAAFCVKNPDCMWAIVVYSLASAVGQNFIYYTITQFNPLILTTVTTTRKIFTTLYSVFRNPANHLSGMQWGGCGMVFVGLLCEVVEKYTCPKKKADPLAAPPAEEMPLAKGAVIDEEEMHLGVEMQSQGGKQGYAKAPR